MTSTPAAKSVTDMELLQRPHDVFRREKIRLLTGLSGAVVLYGLTRYSQVDLARLCLGDGWANALNLIGGITRPDLSTSFLERVGHLMLESFAIGFLGLGLALILGIPLALFGARLPGLQEAPGRRSLLSLFRPLACA